MLSRYDHHQITSHPSGRGQSYLLTLIAASSRLFFPSNTFQRFTVEPHAHLLLFVCDSFGKLPLHSSILFDAHRSYAAPPRTSHSPSRHSFDRSRRGNLIARPRRPGSILRSADRTGDFRPPRKAASIDLPQLSNNAPRVACGVLGYQHPAHRVSRRTSGARSAYHRQHGVNTPSHRPRVASR